MNENKTLNPFIKFFYKIILFAYLKLYRLIHSSRSYSIFHQLSQCGMNTIIDDGVIANRPENITIGSRVFIGKRVILDAYGKINIGDDCSIAADCKIISGNHNFEDINTLINKQGYKISEVSIGDNVWLGFNVLIMPGVNIGSGSIIGAGSIVTKSFPKNSIIAGNPASLLKKR
jgi:acetyltransferase-like isoleucine patch superfamily enzyme